MDMPYVDTQTADVLTLALIRNHECDGVLELVATATVIPCLILTLPLPWPCVSYPTSQPFTNDLMVNLETVPSFMGKLNYDYETFRCCCETNPSAIFKLLEET